MFKRDQIVRIVHQHLEVMAKPFFGYYHLQDHALLNKVNATRLYLHDAPPRFRSSSYPPYFLFLPQALAFHSSHYQFQNQTVCFQFLNLMLS